MSQSTDLKAQGSLISIPRKTWTIAAVIVFGAFMAALDSSLVNVGLATISHNLHSSLASVQLVSSGYLLALGAALPVSAWLGRRLGTGRLWLGSLVVFTVASALCALSPNLVVLIVMRLVQGVSGGLLVPAGQSVIAEVAGRQRIGRVMSTAGVAVVLAPALGPAIGGLLIHVASWRWLFLINVPIGVIALILGSALLPRGKGVKAPLDVMGLILLGGGLPVLSYGIIRASDAGGLFAATAIVPLTLGLMMLLVYVLVARRKKDPILDLSLFHNRTFSAAGIAVFFAGGALFGGMVLFPLYFEVLRGKSVIETGALLLAFGLGTFCSMRLGGRLTDKYGGGIVATAGLAISVATTLPFAFMGADANIVAIEVILLLRGAGIGLAGMPLMSAAFAAAPRELMPHATAEINILQRMAGALGTGVYVSILTHDGAATLASFHLVFFWLTITSAFGLFLAAWVAIEGRRAGRSSA